jgi:hypothetical protein
MFPRAVFGATLSAALTAVYPPTLAGWSFNDSPSPNAFIQDGNMTLELQCDRMRFAPAGYEDARDIERKQGLSMRFMKDGSTEAGAFQAGPENAAIRILDNTLLEILFHDEEDYNFVLDQVAQNAVLNLAMIDGDVSYGVFDLQGSGTVIKSLRAACGPRTGSAPARVEAPEGVVYCGGGAIKRQIEFRIFKEPKDQWDAEITINGETNRAMTAYSYFGKSKPPRGFVVALLGEDRSEFLVFKDGDDDWLEFGDHTYRKCD